MVYLKHVKTGQFVTIGRDGDFVGSNSPELLNCQITAPAQTTQTPLLDRTALSAGDVAHFRQNGYVVLRQAVCPELVRDALREINYHLGRPASRSNEANESVLKLENTTCGEVGCAILNQSPAFWSALNILLGEGNVEPWEKGQQVALRFPQPPQRGHDKPDVKPGTLYHIDGMGQNKLCPFSLLCGVALSDQTQENCGNLHVFPGSHLHPELREYYRDLIDDENQNEADTRKPDLGESVQVLLRPGDVVLAHQLLAHRVGVNTSENIRYQLYYRVSHKDHAALKGGVLEDPWAEFAC